MSPNEPVGDDVWARVAQLAREENPSVLSVVESTRLERLDGQRATLAIVRDSNIAYVRARKGALEALLEKVAGVAARIEFIEVNEGAAPSDPQHSDGPRPTVDQATQARVMQNPVVRKAVELFDARIVEVAPESPGDDVDEEGR